MTASTDVIEELLADGWKVVGFSAQSDPQKDHLYVLIQKGTALRSIRFTDDAGAHMAIGEGRHIRETTLTPGSLQKDT